MGRKRIKPDDDKTQARRELAALMMNRLLQRIPMSDPAHPWNEITNEILETVATKAVIAADLLMRELEAYDGLTENPA
jgi:hypothetical protein